MWRCAKAMNSQESANLVLFRRRLLWFTRFPRRRDRRLCRTLIDNVKEPHIRANTIVVSQIGTHVFRESQQTLDDIRVTVCDVCCLSNVIVQIDEKRFFESDAIPWRYVSVPAKRRSASGFFVSR